ncbi:IS3 family transposase [Glycomyces tenuis]|uniref:IS3 family transposase n=1 Tax=Glycomyces tenuis TaxID=58116 RepID=UPI0009DE8F21
MLRVLGVAPSTYYDWVRASDRPSDHAEVDLGLLSVIYEIWTDSGRTYGADRVWGQLRRDGIRVGRKRVERLMAGEGWAGEYFRYSPAAWSYPDHEPMTSKLIGSSALRSARSACPGTRYTPPLGGVGRQVWAGSSSRSRSPSMVPSKRSCPRIGWSSISTVAWSAFSR